MELSNFKKTRHTCLLCKRDKCAKRSLLRYHSFCHTLTGVTARPFCIGAKTLKLKGKPYNGGIRPSLPSVKRMTHKRPLAVIGAECSGVTFILIRYRSFSYDRLSVDRGGVLLFPSMLFQVFEYLDILYQ